MLTLPEAYSTLISKFAPIFSKRVWRHAQVLLIGAILAPGKRTVTSVLQQKIVIQGHLGVVARDAPFTIFMDEQYLDWSEDER